MSTMSVLSAVAAIGAVVALLSANAGQGERNAAAQAQVARAEPIPAFAQSVNAKIAAYAAAAGPNAPAATASADSAPPHTSKATMVPNPRI